MTLPPAFIRGGRPARLASRRQRRQLAGAYIGVGALLIASAFTSTGRLQPIDPGWRWLVLAGILLAALMVLLIQLQGATRHLAEDPDTALDEMMVRLRSQAYRPSYRILSAFAGVAIWELCLAGSLLPGQVKLSILLAFLVIQPLPVIITAITLPDIDPET
jgi:hypothetical protein